MPMHTEVEEAFAERFGGEPGVVVRAPGRVNLIGEHTDYSDGWVMPVAIDRETWVAMRPTRGETWLESRECGPANPFHIMDVEPGAVTDWGAYAAGVGWALRQWGFEDVDDLEGVVASNIPMGSGLSSSAALEVAVALAWSTLHRWGLDGWELAKVSREAENRFVGVACGIMDQAVCALARPGCAMMLDTRSLEARHVPLPPHWRIVICDTCTPRTLAGSAYNERRREVERAAAELGVASLRDATPESLEAGRGSLDPLLDRRARHVVGENLRVAAFAVALESGDARAAGKAMAESHESLRDLFEVSSLDLDAMAESAAGAPGCIGARMTGAGFGGACVALVEEAQVDEFIEAAGRGFHARTGGLGRFSTCYAVGGACVIDR
ncbi:MAG: galactokinase [Fimbriimonadaceae bacterium]|nr:galactokinase [Fimbriimonadaceae bacterium]